MIRGGGGNTLLTVDAATGAKQVVAPATDRTFREAQPCWKADGSLVVVETIVPRRGRYDRNYVEYRPDGSRHVLGRVGPANTVMIAPGCGRAMEGRLRLPASRESGALIKEIGGRSLLTLPAYWPVEGPYMAWSPDAGVVAEILEGGRRSRIRVTEIATGRTVALKRIGSIFGAIFDGAFSPDGRAVVFHEDGGSGPVDEIRDHVTIFDVATQTFRRLLTTTGLSNAGALQWSPLGDRIAIVVDDRIHLFGVDGSDHGVVAPGARVADLAWSPDGTRIAYRHLKRLRRTGDRDTFPQPRFASRLSVADARPGARGRRLAREVRDEEMAVWSPDGTRLAYLGDP